ncbi:GNAT family N-acetyltransferase [Pseudooctadecabacter jejudonensis]|uniref:Acetyltransferase (GNAT) family protein n=1 Tax=Pseudooctadecabacter jejudonensis TaxID=1391910 RepID=A0A1Y5S263_9RHOB|nr:GNAT family N-acetyltransferase [Pseudooctadecabacter jejudonensis]SLN29938.1 Acetyltransferase (GNAT) family protein [Pseudooctadecabacter jejudonensis]
MTPETLTQLIDATWPAKAITDVAGWTIREGAGGGSRVSATTATTAAKLEEHARAEDAMRALGQTPLFMVRTGEETLDATLAEAGYVIKDPVTYYTAPVATLATQRPPPVTCFEVWPPLATQAEIWDAGGVDDARLAVMARAKGPKTTVLGRIHDTPAGTAFAAIHDGTAMLHAIETSHALRRQGLARHMIRALAFWAEGKGAQTVTLLVTRANTPANALYSSLGMTPVGGYHYRILPEA